MHSQLTQEKRCQMEALVSTGAKQAVIAAILDVHPSTVCRELARNRAKRRRGYCAKDARKQADTFFADPYSSWQRGTNEWLNRRLRRYFPKGTSLADATDADLNKALAKINRCPMKVLGWKTPCEAYYGVERKLTRNCV